MVGEQLVIPVLERGELSGYGDIPLVQQFVGYSVGSGLPSLIVVQAQSDFLQLGLRLQQMVNGGCAHSAQGHIGVVLPSLRVERDVGQQIDGGLKGIQLPAGTWPVKAVLFFTARQCLPKMGAGESTPGMEVPGLALFIPAHKNGVVVDGILVNQPFPGKGGHHLRGDAPGLAQVSEYPPHIFVGGWNFQLFQLFLLGTEERRREAGGQLLQIREGAVQQHGCRPFLGFPVEVAEEVHGVPALLGVLVEPHIVSNGDPLVVKFPLPLATQSLECLPTGAKQGNQVGASRKVSLLFSDGYPPLLHFKFLSMSQLLLGDLLLQLFVYQPGHGRVEVELVGKNLTHLPQEPGCHGQEGRGVVLVLRLSLLHVQLHRRPYHCVADGFEVRVLGERHLLYGSLIIDIPSSLLVLIPQVVELGDALIFRKLVHDLVHQGLEFWPQVAVHFLAFHIGKAISQLPQHRFQLWIFANPAADLLNKAGHFLPAGPPQLVPVGGLPLVHTYQVLAENLLCQRRTDDVHALFGEETFFRVGGVGDEVDVGVVPLIVKGGVPFELGGRDL